MVKVIPAKPFTFEAGKRAVLLLHGFTGNTADVRMLGRFLQKKGYTCHAPLYKGHGVPPEELVKTSPDDWWQDVLNGYDLLQEMGHEQIAVCGLSLGGVFALKLGMTKPVAGIVPMCAPMTMKDEKTLYQGVLDYAREYKRREKKSEEQIEAEMKHFQPMETLTKLRAELVMKVRNQLDYIYAPIFVVQARHDQIIDPNSATIIYENVESEKKYIKWYEHSGHVITMDREKEQLHEDIFQFFEQLEWH